jgi:hypothetical protein
MANELDYTKPGGSVAAVTSNTVARPADTTAYASGDLVANSTTAGSVTPLTWTDAADRPGGGVSVAGVRIRKSGTTTTNASFRVHLFSSAPAVANGDNAAIVPTLMAAYLGYVDVTVGLACSDGAVGLGQPTAPVPLVLGSGKAAYGLVEARGAYTPASAETFSVDLLLVRATR